MTIPPITLLAASGLHGFDYIVIFVYLAAVLWAGWYFSRGQEKSEDYFLGGRRMPWLAVGLSIVATMLSTVTYLAAPGEVIQHGLALSIGWLAVPIAFLIVNFLWIPFFMRLGVTSIYEYLENRFGLVARWTAVALFVFVLRLFWMATIVLTASRAVAQITHGSLSAVLPELSLQGWTMAVVFSVGVLATVYTMLGGIKAVIWTDVAQFIALFGGIVLTLVFVAIKTGTGPAEWLQTTTSSQLGAGHEWPPWIGGITTRNTILFTVLNVVFWYSCTFIADQVAVQRYLTTPSVQAAVRGNVVNFSADLVVMILLALCGMALLTFYLSPEFQTDLADGISDPRNAKVADRVFPHFIEFGLPVGISGLVVAALFAVAMSSLDSGMNSVSAVITVDVYRRLNKSRSPEQELKVARGITLVVGLGCTALAFALLLIPANYNIIGITARTFNCALGPLGAMFVAGMFCRHVGQFAVVLSTLLGWALAIAIAWWVELGWLLGLTSYQTLREATDNIAGPSPFLITPMAAVGTLGMAIVLGFLFPSRDNTRGKSWSWAAVVKDQGAVHKAGRIVINFLRWVLRLR